MFFFLIWNFVFHFKQRNKYAHEGLQHVTMIPFDKQTEQCHINRFANSLLKYTRNEMKFISTYIYIYLQPSLNSYTINVYTRYWLFPFFILLPTNDGIEKQNNAVFCCFKCTIRIFLLLLLSLRHTKPHRSLWSLLLHVHVCVFFFFFFPNAIQYTINNEISASKKI